MISVQRSWLHTHMHTPECFASWPNLRVIYDWERRLLASTVTILGSHRGEQTQGQGPHRGMFVDHNETTFSRIVCLHLFGSWAIASRLDKLDSLRVIARDYSVSKRKQDKAGSKWSYSKKNDNNLAKIRASFQQSSKPFSSFYTSFLRNPRSELHPFCILLP